MHNEVIKIKVIKNKTIKMCCTFVVITTDVL